MAIGRPGPALTALACAALLVLSSPARGEDAPAPDAPSKAAAVVKAARGPRPPRVRRIRPRHRATFVQLDATIRIRFSKSLDPASITEQSIVFGKLSGEPVPWAFQLSKRDRLLTITPQKTLEPGVDYRVQVREGVRSAKGASLRRIKSANFFTDNKFAGFILLRPDQFAAVPSQMDVGRALHTATLISGGHVLLVGGISDQVTITETAELFDYGTGEFRGIGPMASPRVDHAAVPFGAGVLVIGGDDGVRALDTTEISGGSGFSAGPGLVEERAFHAAVKLSGGRVLVVGGLRYVGPNAIFSDTAEIYEPSTGAFRRTFRDPVHRRAGHSMTVLPDGNVLIVGGRAADVEAEIFDPVSETFRETLFKPSEARQQHTATLLDESGSVLLADGGSPRAELFDPVTERYFFAGGSSFTNRRLSTASLMPDGNVLLAGGLEQRGATTLILEGFDVFKRDLGRIFRASVVFAEPRAGHTATTLRDDRVLFVGGFGLVDANLETAVMFTPDPADEP